MDWVGGFQSSTKRCNLKLSGPNVKTGPPTNHVPFIILLSSYVEEGPMAARVTLIPYSEVPGSTNKTPTQKNIGSGLDIPSILVDTGGTFDQSTSKGQLGRDIVRLG